MTDNLITPILQEEFLIKRNSYGEPPYVIPIKGIHVTKDFLNRLLASGDYQQYIVREFDKLFLIGYPVTVHHDGKEDWWFEVIETRQLKRLDKIEQVF